jgi:hypothetical protein
LGYIVMNFGNMRNLLSLFFLLFACSAFAQQFELMPNGFEPVDIPRPNKTNEKLIEISKEWADVYNKQEHDVYNVTENSLDIDAIKENAFFYRNLGEVFTFHIKYTLHVDFRNETCQLKFTVKEIYTKKTLTKMTVADFFMPDGVLKEDFEEAKPSLEKTANNILKSYVRFIQN